MTDKQKRFCEEYIIDLNATQAAIRAGYSAKTANEQGARLLANVSIQAYLTKHMQKRERRTEITADRVLEEIAKLAFFDPRKLFDGEGKPVPVEGLDDATAACIAGLEIMEQPIALVKKYKLTDKRGALELLGRHLGLFTDKVQLSGEVAIDDARARLLEKLDKRSG